MTVGEALAQARTRIDAGEARLLLRHVLAAAATALAAYPERRLSADQQRSFTDLVSRRSAGEPVAYLLGRREFFGREFQVSPAVLIPRPETELLVELAVAKLRGAGQARALDLGSGSGCIAVSLALELAIEVTAVDASPAALAVASANARRHAARVNFLASDWYAALDGVFDLIVANPPYIAARDPHLASGDLRFEPPQALASGEDGLGDIRRIVAEAPRFLAAGGWLLLEHGYDQGDAVLDLLSANFVDLEQHRDLAGIPRVSGGRLPQ